MRKLSGVIVLLLAAALWGCNGTEKTWEDVPWSINVPGLAVRLIVKDTELEPGRYPSCIMEVTNTSRRTILLRKDFSLNGPAVYNQKGGLMPQRRHLEVKASDAPVYHRIGPNKVISIEAKPNFRMNSTGKYTLRFSIHPSSWGFEDPGKQWKRLEKADKEGNPVISNDVMVTVFDLSGVR